MTARKEQLHKSIDEGKYALSQARNRLEFAQEALREAEGSITRIENGLYEDRRAFNAEILKRRDRKGLTG